MLFDVEDIFCYLENNFDVFLLALIYATALWYGLIGPTVLLLRCN